MAQRPYDDYQVGEAFESYGRTITETDIVNFTCFAGLKMPIFIDDEFARKHSIFGTRVAPGLMTASIAAGMMEDLVFGKYTLAAMGLDRFSFKAPVRIGDTLHIRVTVDQKKDLTDGDRGVMTVKVEVINQKGELPLVFYGAFMMRRRAFDE